MAKNNEWLVWVIALVAIVALIIAIVALNKANLTGQGIFEWFKKQETISDVERGLLGNAFISQGGDIELLKGYEVKYDENGDLIYELANTNVNVPGEGIVMGNEIIAGEDYVAVQDEENPLKLSIENVNNGDAYIVHCRCGPANGWCSVQNHCATMGTFCIGICDFECYNGGNPPITYSSPCNWGMSEYYNYD